jgi:hypothetical protein
MHAYNVVAIGDTIADAVRKTMKSPRYGHPAHVELATGYGPCRQCLRTFAIGSERRILFTYDAFQGKEGLPLPGPVFIHEGNCERYPFNGGFPADMLPHGLTFNAYAAGRKLIAQRYATNSGIETQLQALLNDPQVDYIHVRDTEAGCYDFCIERASRNDHHEETAPGGETSHE